MIGLEITLPYTKKTTGPRVGEGYARQDNKYYFIENKMPGIDIKMIKTLPVSPIKKHFLFLELNTMEFGSANLLYIFGFGAFYNGVWLCQSVIHIWLRRFLQWSLALPICYTYLASALSTMEFGSANLLYIFGFGAFYNGVWLCQSVIHIWLRRFLQWSLALPICYTYLASALSTMEFGSANPLHILGFGAFYSGVLHSKTPYNKSIWLCQILLLTNTGRISSKLQPVFRYHIVVTM